jgi:hypothetical protein
VNECEEALLSCASGSLCINTFGSFQCDQISPWPVSLQACSDPYPSTCLSAGGNTLWIFSRPHGTVEPVRASFISTRWNVSVQASPVGGATSSWVEVVCPPSGGAARVSGILERSDGAPVCGFTISYTPSPASVKPLSVSLAGGLVHVDLMGLGSESAAFSGKCTVLFGAFRGILVPFVDRNATPTTLSLIAPPQPMTGPIQLRLKCDSDRSSSAMDLGTTLEYRRSPSLDFATKMPQCMRYRTCLFAVTVLDPPDAASNGLHIRLSRSDESDGDSPSDLLLTKAVQVLPVTWLLGKERNLERCCWCISLG